MFDETPTLAKAAKVDGQVNPKTELRPLLGKRSSLCAFHQVTEASEGLRGNAAGTSRVPGRNINIDVLPPPVCVIGGK
jgi:hypothetical protein